MAYRIDRIEGEIKKELSDIIRGLKDPRISGLLSVIRVEVTPDLRYAKAYISVLAGEEEKTASIKGLEAAAGYIRREIGARIDLRYTPEFSFKLDNSIEYGAHINKILSDVIKKEEE